MVLLRRLALEIAAAGGSFSAPLPLPGKNRKETVMIRNLRVAELKPGMFITDPGIDWTKRPYLYAANRHIRSEAEIREILAQGYEEVYVDFSRSDTPAFSASFPDRQNAGPQATTSLAEELPAARKIHNQSVSYARKFMTDMRSGKMDPAPAAAVVEDIMDSLDRNPDALLSLGRLHRVDTYTHMHCVNVSILTTVFARFLGSTQADIFTSGLSGLFHDLGKALVPLDILNAPRKLSPEEFAAMRQHPLLGHTQLLQIPAIPDAVLKGALEHHEKYNGSGYPNGLEGSRISAIGVMVGIADVYDALSSDRVYKKGMSPHKTLGILYQLGNKEFDASSVAQFIRMMGIYPVGSIVELEDGWKGVVSAGNAESPARPTVRLVLDAAGNPSPIQDKNLAAEEASPISKCLPDFPGIHPARVLGLEE
jgi:HD-GYP domain-containing protein (c-di-GMP phosphodiesterase class II)